MRAFRKLKQCFTKDHYARTGQTLSPSEIIRDLVFNPGYRAVAYYRISLWLKTIRFPRYVCVLLSRLIIVRLSRVPGVEIRTRFEIGDGLLICHPHDIVIGSGARIGKNVTLFNGVTLGARTLESLDEITEMDERYPTIGDSVTIFSGAKIIGPVEIGCNSIVGANAVGNRSFPANSIIAGVPARRICERR